MKFSHLHYLLSFVFFLWMHEFHTSAHNHTSTHTPVITLHLARCCCASFPTEWLVRREREWVCVIHSSTCVMYFFTLLFLFFALRPFLAIIIDIRITLWVEILDTKRKYAAFFLLPLRLPSTEEEQNWIAYITCMDRSFKS